MAESERTIEIPESLAKLLVAEDSDFKDASMAPAARELARASLRVLMLVEPASNGHEPTVQHHRIVTEARANGEPPPPKRFMSAKAKKAISVRMKRYWREKRKAAAK